MNVFLQYLTILLAILIMHLNISCDAAKADSKQEEINHPPSAEHWQDIVIEPDPDDPDAHIGLGSSMVLAFFPDVGLNAAVDYPNRTTNIELWKTAVTYKSFYINGVRCRIIMETGTRYVNTECGFSAGSERQEFGPFSGENVLN